MHYIAQPDFAVFFYSVGSFRRICRSFSTSATTPPDSSVTITVTLHLLPGLECEGGFDPAPGFNCAAN